MMRITGLIISLFFLTGCGLFNVRMTDASEYSALSKQFTVTRHSEYKYVSAVPSVKLTVKDRDTTAKYLMTGLILAADKASPNDDLVVVIPYNDARSVSYWVNMTNYRAAFTEKKMTMEDFQKTILIKELSE